MTGLVSRAHGNDFFWTEPTGEQQKRVFEPGDSGRDRGGGMSRPRQAAGAPTARLRGRFHEKLLSFSMIYGPRPLYSREYGWRPAPPVTAARAWAAPLLGTPAGRRRCAQPCGPWPPRSTRGRRAAGPCCSARSRATRTP